MNCDKETVNKNESEIYFRLKAKKMPRFKAGPELAKTKTIRWVEVEIEENKTETSEELKLELHLAEKHIGEEIKEIEKA
jgi:hypothetical protein